VSFIKLLDSVAKTNHPGNGCSATQFVPIISSGPDKVKKVTQFSRQAHWLSERLNPKYSESFKAFMKYFPGAIFAYRAYLYWLQERDFAGFHVEAGIETRNEWTRTSTDYIKRNAPEKYAEALVPKTVIACKRRVTDTDYLKCLHRDNVELVFDDPIKEITEDGVITHSNRFIHADVITFANGFETQKTLFPMEIRGESGQTVSDYVSFYCELSCKLWLIFIVGPSERWCFASVPGNLHRRLPKFLRFNGTKHPLWTFIGHLYDGVPDRIRPPSYATHCEAIIVL
jgi:cation diffusion facilitator CzcD-associated flavoprotein CzcO